MKISTQFVVLVAVIVVGLGSLVLGLAVFADWPDGAIIGMVSAFGSIATGLIIAIRNQQHTAQTLDDLQRQVGIGQRLQDAKLNQVVKQTNGPTSPERAALARMASAQTIQDLKNGGHL